LVSSEFAIADTCFLIDWARYRDRDILFKVFNVVFIPETVLREVKSEGTITWIASRLTENKLALYTEVEDEVEEARRLVEISRRIPHTLPIDLPEAICLVVGKVRGYVVLTENKGAIMISEVINEYRDVVVWRALEVLLTAHLTGVLNVDCSDPLKHFTEYQEDTLHIFPRKDVTEVRSLIESRCR